MRRGTWPQGSHWRPSPRRTWGVEMRKFAVRLGGENFVAEVTSETGRSSVATGFFTTRFVEATTASEAGGIAIRLVERELTQRQVRQLPESSIAVVEVWEDPRAFSLYAPGSGFSWY